ncbi:hypothetical protein ABZ626_18535 [Streptomyces longispororuber]|uniref:hypothetical protein n=1 Tax=Streptomyces longispororuber TaxID=68230 RepID=UPI0033E9579C
MAEELPKDAVAAETPCAGTVAQLWPSSSGWQGQAALRREVRDGLTKVNARLDALEEKMYRHQAQIIELLSGLVGKSPDAS